MITHFESRTEYQNLVLSFGSKRRWKAIHDSVNNAHPKRQVNFHYRSFSRLQLPLTRACAFGTTQKRRFALAQYCNPSDCGNNECEYRSSLTPSTPREPFDELFWGCTRWSAEDPGGGGPRRVAGTALSVSTFGGFMRPMEITS